MEAMYYAVIQLRRDKQGIFVRLLSSGKIKEDVLSAAQSAGTTDVDVICSPIGEGESFKDAIQNAKSNATAFCSKKGIDLSGLVWFF